MSKEIEMYLEKNHLSYNSAIRNNVGELVGIGDLIDQNTKPLLDEIAELRKALNQIQDYQMDFVELARTTTVYKIAESALNKLKASKSEANEADILHWTLHNYKPYEDGMNMVWRNINPDIDTLHTSKQLYEIFKTRNNK